MEGNESVSVPKLKIIACRHPDAADPAKGQTKATGTPAKDKGDKEREA